MVGVVSYQITTYVTGILYQEMKLPFFSVTATELVSGVSGESEHNIRNLFRQVGTPKSRLAILMPGWV